MHRYWAAAFPEDYAAHVLPPEWYENYRDEVFQALSTLDMIIDKASRLCSSLDATLVVGGSLGQVAVGHKPVRQFMTMTDAGKFMTVLGLEPSEFKVRHAMVPSSGAVVATDRVAEICRKLDTMTINGRGFKQSVNEIPPLSYGVYDNGYISFFTYFGNDDVSGVVTLGNREFTLEEAGFTVMENDDGVAVTAHHDREGALLIRTPDRRPQFSGRRTISTTDIAPAILARFGIDKPDYMATPGADLVNAFAVLKSRLAVAN